MTDSYRVLWEEMTGAFAHLRRCVEATPGCSRADLCILLGQYITAEAKWLAERPAPVPAKQLPKEGLRAALAAYIAHSGHAAPWRKVRERVEYRMRECDVASDDDLPCVLEGIDPLLADFIVAAFAFAAPLLSDKPPAAPGVSAAAPAPGEARAAPLSADDHPGGPLSRAERVVLSNMRKTVFSSQAAVGGLSHIMGAVPGAQKIEAAHRAAMTAINRLLEAIKTRKQGAPMPRARASDATSAGGGE